MTAKAYGALLRLAAEQRVAGGGSYDAVIGACAEKGKAATLLTFNANHFTALGKNFTVVVPGSV